MRCLNCNAEMTNYDVVIKSAELSYDVCEKCGGLWLDRGELDKMAFQVAGSIEFCSEQEAGIAGRPRRTCPRCDGVSFLPFDSLVKLMSFWITAEIAAGSGLMAAS